VIPCFRESERLPIFLADLVKHLATQDFLGRVTIVDDGSGKDEVQRTRARVEQVLQAFPEAQVGWLLLPANQGKGGAVYAGWKKAITEDADILAFADADGSTSGAEVCRIVHGLIERAGTVDAVFGSRIKMLGQDIQRELYRHLMGRCFATLVGEMTGLLAYDTQCGAKAIKASAFEGIASKLHERGFAFDVELTLALLNSGYRVIELPISWREVPGSKVRFLRDIIRMAMAILRIRKRHGRFAAAGKP